MNAIVPLSLSVGSVASSVAAPTASSSRAVMVGASLVPVMVTVTDLVDRAAMASLIVTVKLSVAVWSTARYCVALLATL